MAKSKSTAARIDPEADADKGQSLLDGADRPSTSYTANDIEVLEGLEPVRHRPGMYIGGTDERALHHLASEILDNAMDEAVHGHATRIGFDLEADGTLTVSDNGRGIPTDPHPKFPGKSALEVILTTLHSGGKFKDGVYQTAGGLHGVGISVVNALSDLLTVEVARDRRLMRQTYSRGHATSPLELVGEVANRRGTTVAFHPDPDIFGADARLKPERLYRLARSKAYLYRGVEIRWRCAAELIRDEDQVPASATLHFPGGLNDFLGTALTERECLSPTPFEGEAQLADGRGRVEWAIAWPEDGDGFVHSYCNTIPTPQGGTHEQGLRQALVRGVRAHGELAREKRVAQVTADDIFNGAAVLISVFLSNPQFQGQTKERLASAEATRLVDAAIKDRFDHWLAADPAVAKSLVEAFVERAEERQRRRDQKDLARKSATRRLRLPGKLADCSRETSDGTEIFLVEGDSAGGSAKQARNRETQAILPLRGKVRNAASASADKVEANKELETLRLALGCGSGRTFDLGKLRYERVIIMTDADVDGAHIASLLITFFYLEMRGIIEAGRLYLAQPPLYRVTQGAKGFYAQDDAEKDALLDKLKKGSGKVEVSRFKGLGEMMPAQLKDTTMDPAKRRLLRVSVPSAHDPETSEAAAGLADLIERLMGRKPEPRYQFIQNNARFVRDLDV